MFTAAIGPRIKPKLAADKTGKAAVAFAACGYQSGRALMDEAAS